MDKTKLSHEDYTVGWICALQCELHAARAMLDEEHRQLPPAENDTNSYLLGSCGEHKVVIVTAAGQYGDVEAAEIATQMTRTYSKIRFLLMVGIGGGVPQEPNLKESTKDIRLGDVVVSRTKRPHAGVFHYDFGSRTADGNIEIRSHLNKPPQFLLRATSTLESDHVYEHGKMVQYIEDVAKKAQRLSGLKPYRFPGRDKDLLFPKDYRHVGDEKDCSQCDATRCINRLDRESDHPSVHYGEIASGNWVIKDPKMRDELRDSYGIQCIETEAAGLMNHFSCLVIRGICDYCDDHKGDIWQPYAAVVAAAYAKDLLRVIEPTEVERTDGIYEQLANFRESVQKGFDGIAKNQEVQQKEAELAEQNRKRQEAKQQFEVLKDRLRPRRGLSEFLLNDISTNRHPDTCEWLLDRPDFLNWASNGSEKPSFWLTGQHGAGKSFLCSAAIQFIQENRGHQAVICEFLTKDTPISRTQILRNLALQLLDNLNIVTEELPDGLRVFLNIHSQNPAELEDLIKAIVSELPATFIFIDGPDEADYPDNNSHITSLPMVKEKEEGIRKLLQFLHRLVRSNAESTRRLWVSTQWNRSDLHWLDYSHSCYELMLSSEDTMDDIITYMLSAFVDLMESNPEAARLLSDEIESLPNISGSFVFASTLFHEFKKGREDKKQLRDILSEVPRTMEDQYSKILDRIIQVGQNSREETPTWKISLSIVAFSRRPLSISQLIEVIAILRTNDFENLDKDRLVTRQDILGQCRDFLHLLPIGNSSDPSQVLVRMSHSSARDFLLNQQTLDKTMIQKCCIRYLLQPKYNQPLRKISSKMFELWTGEDVESQHFLSYAAKYWHLHFDMNADELQGRHESKGAPQLCSNISDSVIHFLKSSNFVTCIQVQSLNVVGHFMQSFDPVTHEVDYMKRAMPNWLIDDDLEREYMDFVREWGELLQWGLFEEFNGEIDRCFWKSLGPTHFLSKGKCRYRHFQLSSTDPSVPSENRLGQLQNISPDGKEALCTYLFYKGPKVKVSVELWDLVAQPEPRLKESQTYTIPGSIPNEDQFSVPGSMLLPVIPNRGFSPPPDLFHTDIQSSVLRVGNQYFLIPREDSTAKSTTSTLTRLPVDGFWEHIFVSDSVRVVCRRKTLNILKPSQLVASYEDNTSDSDPESMSDLDLDSSDDQLSGTSFCSSDQLSIASAASLPDDCQQGTGLINELDDLTSDYGEWEADDREESIEIENDESSHEYSDIPSIASSLDLDEIMEQSSCDERSIQSVSSGISLLETDPINEGAENQYPVTLTRPERSDPLRIRYYSPEVVCDQCDNSIQKRGYFCRICNKTGSRWDMCRRCMELNKWCLSSEHQLLDVAKGKIIGVISKNRHRVRQQLKLYDTRKGSEPFIQVSENYNRVLYGSPPAIHPRRSLVAWAVTDLKLVVIDFSNHRRWVKDIVPKYKMYRAICVNMAFSSCGDLLRIAKVEAVYPQEQEGLDEPKSKKPKLHYYLHVLVLRLSSPNKPKIDPQLTGSATMQIGCSIPRISRQPPFAFTWTDKWLFLTVSSSTLRVYRTDLSMVTNSYCSGKRVSSTVPESSPSTSYILPSKDSHPQPLDVPSRSIFTTPDKIIFLPRSSINRAVQFFPNPVDEGGPSSVIVGPRFGKHPQPGMIVYLTEQDLGVWQNIANKECDGARQESAHLRVAGRFEVFDTEEDCDIRPALER